MAFLDETGLAELWKLIKSEDAKGAKTATGSYTGTGKNGASNPCSLTFDFTPQVVFLYKTLGGYSNPPVVLVWGKTPSMAWNGTATNYLNPVSYSGNTISWYSTADAAAQANTSGQNYTYTAFG